MRFRPGCSSINHGIVNRSIERSRLEGGLSWVERFLLFFHGLSSFAGPQDVLGIVLVHGISVSKNRTESRNPRTNPANSLMFPKPTSIRLLQYLMKCSERNRDS
jgi:hypothetical protein